MCESVWEPNMNPEELFESISQALLNAQDRDCLSGWGATVHIMLVINFFITYLCFFFWKVGICCYLST